MYKLRNIIAHAGIRISTTDLDKVKGIKDIKIESYVDFHIISITSPEMNRNLISLVDEYFTELVKEVDIRVGQLRKLKV